MGIGPPATKGIEGMRLEEDISSGSEGTVQQNMCYMEDHTLDAHF